MQTALAQPWQVTASPEASRWYVRLLPSLTDFAFVLPLFLLFGMLSGPTRLLSDGDTGWHIRTGDWILTHGRVPTVDLFSFSMPGKPWFAWEWGWDLLFAAVHRSAGLAGVAFVNIALLCLASALVFRLIRRYTDHDVLAFGFTIFAVCGSVIHWWARPHLVSWVFALMFSHLILSAEQGNRKALLYAPALMVLWTNLHGGFFLGILLLLASAAGEALQAILDGARISFAAYRRVLDYLACALACGLATLVNPYGWALHGHLVSYLRDSTLLDNIAEFQSLSFHKPGSIFFECMLLLGAAAAFWCFSNKRAGLAFIVLFWAHAALFSCRNIPLFMLFSAVPAALLTQHVLRRLGRKPAFATLRAEITDTLREFKRVERAGRVYAMSGVGLLVVAAGLASGKGVFHSEFNPKNFPSQAIDVAHKAGFKHLFTTDQWADYLIYRYYPSERVFFDGRSDFYGMDLLRKYQHMINAQFDCEELLKKYSIDGVMLKSDAPLATLLKHSSAWTLLFDDGSTILFEARKGGAK
ncbi:MAG: hypothetical protein JO051_15605 [Acidobacteriaceae bacterium]|nr:hypothetical protein [Acidobacteriaceae bacterium]